MLSIRYVEQSDHDFWFKLDHHLPEAMFDRKVRDRSGYILLLNEQPIGLLRYNLFWDNTPFCTMLFIEAMHRGKGYGRALMEHWEADMHACGYGMVFTSTQADERAQHFYRKLGYKDCGSFLIDIPAYAQPMELLMMKAI